MLTFFSACLKGKGEIKLVSSPAGAGMNGNLNPTTTTTTKTWSLTVRTKMMQY